MFYKKLQKLLLLVAIAITVLSPMPGIAKEDNKSMAVLSMLPVLNGKEQVVDLTRSLDSKTPTYSGDKEEMHYHVLTSVDKDGYASGEFSMPEHFGTHVDAPYHFIKDGKFIDQIDPRRLILQSVVIDVREETQANPDYTLTVDKIKAWEKNGTVPHGAAVLLFTGWSDFYSTSDKYRNTDAKGVMHFPGFSAEAVNYLINNRQVSALGIDTLSIDKGSSEEFLAHKAALSHDLFLMENLANLDKLSARGSWLFCGPLKITGGTGSPARILAIVH